jgi:hypothetical protein
MKTATKRARNWDIPKDNGVMDRAAIAALLARDDYPETTSFTQRIEHIDFAAHGQSFTQTAVVLEPKTPRLNGKRRLVVVGAEPGSEYGMDFLRTPEGGEGPAIWLAKRGVTFVALTRLGRWNYLAANGDGAWDTIPLDRRMPIFQRAQKTYWGDGDYETHALPHERTRHTESAQWRTPSEGSALHDQMLAATPDAMIEGYRRALARVLPPRKRAQSCVLFWGMSTGGAFLYPLAQSFAPDGYLGWGTSTSGLAALYRGARGGAYTDAYVKSALRVRQRGFDDFARYTKELDEATRDAWWANALKSPRFKSGEDMAMRFGAAALAETALRLWNADFLPAAERKRGLADLTRRMMEPVYPPVALKGLPVLDLNGTLDEALPPATVDVHRSIMEPYAKRYRVGRIEGLHHYLFKQESIKIVGSAWLRYIDSGFFG